jgi:hypothetical protein
VSYTWLRRLACRLLGHRRPLLEFMSADVCSRCDEVVRFRAQVLWFYGGRRKIKRVAKW